TLHGQLDEGPIEAGRLLAARFDRGDVSRRRATAVLRARFAGGKMGDGRKMKLLAKRLLGAAMTILAATTAAGLAPAAAADKPNILVIMGDDVGYWNVSAYNRGMMGYHTPNIDRIAKEGAIFTDYYAGQSCTAGRSAFITGQTPLRTGLTKVGVPGAKEG